MRVVVHQFDGVATLQALPLAAGLLVASARRDPLLASRVTLDVASARVAPDAAAERSTGADVLAFSTYVWNERYSLEVARRARASFPGRFVLFGGPSIPREGRRAARYLREHPFIDALAFGEGELVFREVLGALDGGQSLDDVPGLALQRREHPEGAVLTAPRTRIADFEPTGSPYLDGTFDGLLAAGARPDAAIVETNRGCPFACTFCDWGQAIQTRVRELPRERLDQELDWIAEQEIPYLYIVDANYGIRKRDLSIVQGIGERRLRAGNPRYVFFHLTKNAHERHLALVQTLKNAGIGTHLALSAQDFEPRVLAAVKRDNIRLDRALDLRRACHEAGIPTFNELILGLPEQTYASFARSMVRAVTPYPLDAFNLYLARLLENAEMAEDGYRERHGIESRWLKIASFHHERPEHVQELEEVVVATRALPIEDWKRAYAFGYFLAALHNLRLLDVVLQVVWRSNSIDPQGFVERLLAHLQARGSELAGVLARHAAAVVGGEAMVLPHPATGEHLWPVEDALLLSVMLDREGFFSAVEELVLRDHPDDGSLHAALSHQRLITPGFGAGARRGWSPHPTLSAAEDVKSFVTRYLALVHARIPTGQLAREGS